MKHGIEKAAADADGRARRALRGAKQLTSPRGRRPHKRRSFPPRSSSFDIFGNLCYARGFQLALPSRTFLNAAIRTSSVVSTLRGAPHSAFAECGRRRLSLPPHARSPLRGLRGAALRHRYISFCVLVESVQRGRAFSRLRRLKVVARLRRATFPFCCAKRNRARNCFLLLCPLYYFSIFL